MQQYQLFSRNDISLYIHYPFCVHKCPYCDFGSIAWGSDLQRDKQYIDCLIAEFKLKLPLIGQRKFCSVYIGGGTPSLCPAEQWQRLLAQIQPYLMSDAEISLEANPGTVDLAKLQALRQVGFNRISVGVQSFNDQALKRLGRIHNSKEAILACENAKLAGFNNFNIDLMHGLPQQDVKQALFDLEQAVALDCTHLSWYELTIEEGTYFGKHPPELPAEDMLFAIENAGFDFLAHHNFEHYEVSGFAKIIQDQNSWAFPHRQLSYRCRHNQNYWLNGDYLGIGVGASQRISLLRYKYLNSLVNVTKAQALFSQLKLELNFKQEESNFKSCALEDDCYFPATLSHHQLDLINQIQSLAKQYDNSFKQDCLEESKSFYLITRSTNPESYFKYINALLVAQQRSNQTVGSKIASQSQITNEINALEFETKLKNLKVKDGNSLAKQNEVKLNIRELNSSTQAVSVLDFNVVEDQDLPFEFMLNRLRLINDPISAYEFSLHSGLSLDVISATLDRLEQWGYLISDSNHNFALTKQGKLGLNTMIEEFV